MCRLLSHHATSCCLRDVIYESGQLVREASPNGRDSMYCRIFLLEIADCLASQSPWNVASEQSHNISVRVSGQGLGLWVSSWNDRYQLATDKSVVLSDALETE